MRLKNTRRRLQCDGSYAQGDGLVAKVFSQRSDGPTTARSSAARDAADQRRLKPCWGSAATRFGRFYLGRAFEGLALRAVLRDCDRPVKGEPYPGRTNVMTAVYGDCRVPASQDGGCLPPLEISSAPACEDNPSLYRRYPGAGGLPTAHRSTRLRSTSAASFDDGRLMEIYTGATTITVAGDDARQVRRAATALRSAPAGLRVRMNGPARKGAGLAALARAARSATASAPRPGAVAAGAAMPAPARGALAGRLSC